MEILPQTIFENEILAALLLLSFEFHSQGSTVVAISRLQSRHCKYVGLFFLVLQFYVLRNSHSMVFVFQKLTCWQPPVGVGHWPWRPWSKMSPTLWGLWMPQWEQSELLELPNRPPPTSPVLTGKSKEIFWPYMKLAVPEAHSFFKHNSNVNYQDIPFWKSNWHKIA